MVRFRHFNQPHSRFSYANRMIESNDSSNKSNHASPDPNKIKQVKKRSKKRMRKDQDGSNFENPDDNEFVSDNGSRDDVEETKSPLRTPRSVGKRRSTFVVCSDSNNGYLSDDDSSHMTPAKNLSKKVKEGDDDNKSSLSPKPLHKRAKLKVKKIDEEGVCTFLGFPFRCLILQL